MTTPEPEITIRLSRADAERIRGSLESDAPWLGGLCDDLLALLIAALSAEPDAPDAVETLAEQIGALGWSVKPHEGWEGETCYYAVSKEGDEPAPLSESLEEPYHWIAMCPDYIAIDANATPNLWPALDLVRAYQMAQARGAGQREGEG